MISYLICWVSASRAHPEHACLTLVFLFDHVPQCDLFPLDKLLDSHPIVLLSRPPEDSARLPFPSALAFLPPRSPEGAWGTTVSRMATDCGNGSVYSLLLAASFKLQRPQATWGDELPRSTPHCLISRCDATCRELVLLSLLQHKGCQMSDKGEGPNWK